MLMNHSKFKKRSCIVIVCSMLLMGLLFTHVSPAVSGSDVIKWTVALWGGERDWTRPLHYWAKDMAERTNGRWQIELSYGSVLSPSKEHLDGIKGGLFEACQFCASYAPGKTPLITVFELPFILPHDAEKISQLMAALYEHPAIRKELARWKAVPLLPAAITMYGLMSNKPVRTVEDLKGLRIRLAGEMARVVAMFGAVPAMMPGSDFYEAMERGTIDALSCPWAFCYGAFKINEVSKYAITNFDPGSQACAYVANKDAWNALPKEFKKLHMEWYKKAPKVWGEEYRKGDERWIPIYKKQGIEFMEFAPESRAQLLSKAEGVYKEWIKRMEDRGLPGQEVFDYFMAKRKEIAGY
jgi:TRAP-type C4-dicarboxylate transport system substrate-binding protein